MKTSFPKDKPGTNAIQHRAVRIKKYFVCGAIAWVVLICTFLYWDISRERDKQLQFALQEARTHLFEDHALQMWITSHSQQKNDGEGRAEVGPNPSAEIHAHEVTKFDDEMLHKHSATANSHGAYDFFHVRHTIFHTQDSLEEWQHKAIEAFENDAIEYYELEEETDGPVLHMSTPILVRNRCFLNCHSVDSVPLGDEIYGMSVSVPIGPMFELNREHLYRMAVSLGTVCLLGLILIGFTGQRIIRHVRDTEHLYQKIARDKAEALFSKIRFESIFNSITDGVVFSDVDRRIIMVNKGFEDLFGYSPDEIIGQQTRMFYADPEQHVEKGYQYYNKNAEAGQPVYEIEYRRKDGSLFMSETLASKVIGNEGEILGYLAIFRDITQRYIVSKELSRSRQRLEVMLKLNEMAEDPEAEMVQYGLEECVKLTDSTVGYFHFISKDQKNIELFTWSGDVMESCRLPKDDEHRVYPLQNAGIWADCIRKGEPVVHNDYQDEPDRKGYPEGHTQVTRHMSVPLFDKNRMVAIIGVGNKEEPYTDFDVQQVRIISQSMLRLFVRQREVQEREKLQLRLRQASKMEAIGTLAGGIAHDFNNILGIIHGNADMAMEDIPAENPVQKNIFRILQAAKRAKEIIRQILLYSRQGEMKLEVVNPCELVDQSLDLLRSTLPTTVKIETTPCKEEVFIRADRTMFQQLLMNLFVNATDAMQEKGTITIRGEVAQDKISKGVQKLPLLELSYFLLSVTDSGGGMDEATMSRIFDPFFTTKQPTEGTGMGLSTVHGIVENHSGVIDVESEPDKGTTFYVYFPLTKSRMQKADITTSTGVEKGFERILFVDDEAMIAEMGSSMLSRLGYQVTPMSSSPAALELFRSAPSAFDLVITDQSMPDLSGFELSEKLLNIRPDLPIILCTGFSKQVNREKALELGIREFIFKPLDREKLSAAIRTALAKTPVTS